MSRHLTVEAIATICEHMNEDHGDAIVGYARALGGVEDAQSASIAKLDAAGMDLDVQTPSGARSVRVAFDHTLLDADDAKETLIRLARETASISHGIPS
jgi:putative heme iron utilization protein